MFAGPCAPGCTSRHAQGSSLIDATDLPLVLHGNTAMPQPPTSGRASGQPCRCCCKKTVHRPARSVLPRIALERDGSHLSEIPTPMAEHGVMAPRARPAAAPREPLSARQYRPGTGDLHDSGRAHGVYPWYDTNSARVPGGSMAGSIYSNTTRTPCGRSWRSWLLSGWCACGRRADRTRDMPWEHPCYTPRRSTRRLGCAGWRRR